MSEGAQDRAFADVQAELVHERARALGRAGRTVERHLERCDLLRERVVRAGASGDDDELEARIADYRSARRDFDDALLAFCVHREAIGLNDHTWVHRIYRTPPSVADLRAAVQVDRVVQVDRMVAPDVPGAPYS